MSDRGCWFTTYTGLAFYPLDPDPCAVSIEDIAHHLALQCRFTGAVRSFYSVAEHSYRLSMIVPAEDALWGLLHDAAEAYLVDVPRPLKRHSELGEPYKAIERQVMHAICLRFGLPLEEPASVKAADLQMLVTEKRDLLARCEREWTDPAPGTVSELPERIEPWEWGMAEFLFLERFRELRGSR
jgi:5'-deoxynucleotidase YfbR-like HD superfamily hydrolase